MAINLKIANGLTVLKATSGDSVFWQNGWLRQTFGSARQTLGFVH